MDAQQGDFDSSRKAFSEYTNSSSREEGKLHIPDMDYGSNDDDSKKKKKIAVKSADDGFVALDIAQLAAAAPATVDHSFPAAAATGSPGGPVVMKSLSRKLPGGGPHRGGGEAVCLPAVGGTSGGDVPPLLGYVAPEGEAASVAGGRCRRASAGRRASPWRDPRRVLFVFASLSCVGTLILLYLALSMGRMTTDVDADS